MVVGVVVVAPATVAVTVGTVYVVVAQLVELFDGTVAIGEPLSLIVCASTVAEAQTETVPEVSPMARAVPVPARQRSSAKSAQYRRRMVTNPFRCARSAHAFSFRTTS